MNATLEGYDPLRHKFSFRHLFSGSLRPEINGLFPASRFLFYPDQFCPSVMVIQYIVLNLGNAVELADAPISDPDRIALQKDSDISRYKHAEENDWHASINDPLGRWTEGDHCGFFLLVFHDRRMRAIGIPRRKTLAELSSGKALASGTTVTSMGRLKVLITWKELTGDRPTKELLHGRLARYSLQPVLLGLSRLSAQLVTWQNRHNAVGELEAVRRMLPRYYPAIKKLTDANPDRVILSRITLLYVAKQALIACPLDGSDIETQWDAEQIMTCSLIANDLLLGRVPRPQDATIDKAASLLPFSNYLPDPDDPFDIPRNLMLMSDIAPQLANRADYRDLAGEFHRATKLTPQTFCEFVFCVATKFLTNLPEQNNSSGLILTSDYFQHTSIREGLTEFLSQYSISIANLQTTARRNDSLDDDFLLFQEHPLIEFLPDQRMCIDPGFLLDKAGRSFYWTLHANTPPGSRKHLLGYWASIVERYTQWVAGQTYQGRGTLTNNPRFPNNDEACDLMIKEGSRLVLIEVKAGILTAKAKYSFDAELLKGELLRKAIFGDEEERKGIAQLHRAIQRFHNGEAISGLAATEISTVYPVIVFMDKSFTSPYLGTLYREHFDRTTLRRKPTTTPPYSVTMSDLESILPYTHRHDLTDIIDEYYRCNRTNDGGVAFGRFAYANVPLLRDTPRGRDVVRERFRRFYDDLISNTFPSNITEKQSDNSGT
jgi:hypothetical protein